MLLPSDSPDGGPSHKEQRQEQRQEQGRKQREADALAQQEKIRKRKEKKERRQSLAANTAAPRLSQAQMGADAVPLFPDSLTDYKVSPIVQPSV